MKHKMGRGKKILNPPWDVWKSFKSPFLTIFILAKWNERRRHRRKETSFDVDVDVVKNIKSSAQRFELLIVHSPAPPPLISFSQRPHFAAERKLSMNSYEMFMFTFATILPSTQTTPTVSLFLSLTTYFPRLIWVWHFLTTIITFHDQTCECSSNGTVHTYLGVYCQTFKHRTGKWKY